MVQPGPGGDERAAGLGHLLAVERDHAVGEHPGGRAKARRLQHCRPEQGVEVDDVLADEMIDLGL